MKLGMHLRLPDGRIATAVFNGLTGVGIKWGIHYPKEEDFAGTSGDLFIGKVPDNWPWYPDAMLRHSGLSDVLQMECVGENYEILTDEEAKEASAEVQSEK